MDKSDILKRIVAVVKSISPDSIDDSSVSLDTRIIEDLDLDSISLMMLAASLEEAFNIHPTDKRISEFVTIGDIVDYVARHSK